MPTLFPAKRLLPASLCVLDTGSWGAQKKGSAEAASVGRKKYEDASRGFLLGSRTSTRWSQYNNCYWFYLFYLPRRRAALL